MLDKIKTISWPAQMAKHRIVEKKTLPPRFGIVSTNSSKSSNSMYEEARQLPWFFCHDTILNSMCTRISTLKEANKNETGIVPQCAQTMEQWRKNCAGMTVIQLEPAGDCYTVTHPKKKFKLTMLLKLKRNIVHVGYGKSLVFHVWLQWLITVSGITNH
jgi:hypothetical protein